MPFWEPQPVWQGKDCFVLGGGSSLRGFNWELLYDERVIGCNQAWRLGPQVCDYLFFADKKFFMRSHVTLRQDVYEGLSLFSNPVVTNHPDLLKRPEVWLKVVRRKGPGLHKDAVGHNGNSGAMAINLAILLGATVIYLLGFDLRLDKQHRPNWHDFLIEKPATAKLYAKFQKSFDVVRKSLHEDFAYVRVINVSSCSRLQGFPIMNFEPFWMDRKGVCSTAVKLPCSNVG